ncbi:MAG: nucleoside diphosphate kinase regulator [Pseudomonadota bacterium]
MAHPRSVLVGELDNARLQALMKQHDREAVELLFDELDAATVVPDGELPPDVVAMGSTVTFVDTDSGRESTVSLVYPKQADATAGAVSVLAPVGAALIGLREGETIEWPIPNGAHRRLRVVKVRQQAAE